MLQPFREAEGCVHAFPRLIQVPLVFFKSKLSIHVASSMTQAFLLKLSFSRLSCLCQVLFFQTMEGVLVRHCKLHTAIRHQLVTSFEFFYKCDPSFFFVALKLSKNVKHTYVKKKKTSSRNVSPTFSSCVLKRIMFTRFIPRRKGLEETSLGEICWRNAFKNMWRAGTEWKPRSSEAQSSLSSGEFCRIIFSRCCCFIWNGVMSCSIGIQANMSIHDKRAVHGDIPQLHLAIADWNNIVIPRLSVLNRLKLKTNAWRKSQK